MRRKIIGCKGYYQIESDSGIKGDGESNSPPAAIRLYLFLIYIRPKDGDFVVFKKNPLPPVRFLLFRLTYIDTYLNLFTLKSAIMSKTITQTVVFKDHSAVALYNQYLNPAGHSAAIGAPVRINKKQGSSFSAHNKYITGKNLQLVAGRLIVQSWRGSDWKKTDLDSTLVLHFEQKDKDALLHMVHVNVPDDQSKGVAGGWTTHYWTPWKKYLSQKKKSKSIANKH